MDFLTIVSTLQAISSAITIWQNERNYELTKEEFEKTFSLALESRENKEVAEKLSLIIPNYVAKTFKKNIKKCWKNFDSCIGKKHTDHEICEVNTRRCLCSNFKSLSRVNGCLPQEFVDLWNSFNCGVKPDICN